MLTRLNLDLDSALIQLPLPALCIRLPKQHNPLAFRWDNQPFEIRSILLSQINDAKSLLTVVLAAGQSLRGSGDLHAFGDSNLYLRRVQHLEVVSPVPDPPPPSLPEQVLAPLASGVVLTRAKLRDTLAVKNERLGQALESLERAGRLHRTQGGWQRLD